MKVKVKICGLVNVKDADILNKNQVDFAGFVLFFQKSKRCIDLIKAKEIMACLHPSIKTVAVTVSPTLEQVKQIELAGFDILQVHGVLLEEVLEFSEIPILRAVNISDKETEMPIIQEESNRMIGYVFDGSHFGGGKIFNWNDMKPQIDQLFYHNGKRVEKQFILAGGLDSKNVAKAIQMLHPDVVDVSSGVELEGVDSKGRSLGKDSEEVEQFCKNAHDCDRNAAFSSSQSVQ